MGEKTGCGEPWRDDDGTHPVLQAYKVRCLLPLLLGLGRAGASAQAPAAGKAKVDRRVLGLMTPYLDALRPWINGPADPTSQHDPTLEWLVEVDAETDASKPWLAESWTLGADGRSWHVTLQQGVLSQHGYGAFTARDVVHTPALWCNERDPGRKAPSSRGYREGMCAVQRLAVVHDHEIVRHGQVPCLAMPWSSSSAANVLIVRTAQ